MSGGLEAGTNRAIIPVLTKTGMRYALLGRAASVRAVLSRAARRWPYVVAFLGALGWIFLIEMRFRDEASGGLYFHAWTSEYMMQTVSVRDLRIEPFRSLWYNHIQPPAFDAIRAALVAWYSHVDGAELMRRVDAGLYGLWMIVYATTAVLVLGWLRRVCGSRSAVVGFSLFLLLPGPVFYATFLDTTLLSATLVLCFFWTLWRFGRGEAAPGLLALVSITLPLTRSVFQWPFLIVLGASLIMMGTPMRRVLRALVPVILFILAFHAKQYVLFGLTTTSSFGPDSFCKGLSARCPGTTVVPLPKITDRSNALVLRRVVKLNGQYNYNQMAFLKTSFSEMEEYKGLLSRLTPERAFELLRTNVGLYLRPTSRHSSHVIVDRLPWRAPVEWLFSGWSFVVLLILSTAMMIRRSGDLAGEARRSAILHGLGLALPALYIAAVTIVFESGENMRYRFFLEPTLFVFVWTSLSPGRGSVARLAASPPAEHRL